VHMAQVGVPQAPASRSGRPPTGQSRADDRHHDAARSYAPRHTIYIARGYAKPMNAQAQEVILNRPSDGTRTTTRWIEAESKSMNQESLDHFGASGRQGQPLFPLGQNVFRLSSQ
jgi:hypothetical protein